MFIITSEDKIDSFTLNNLSPVLQTMVHIFINNNNNPFFFFLVPCCDINMYHFILFLLFTDMNMPFEFA